MADSAFYTCVVGYSIHFEHAGWGVSWTGRRVLT
jgi:hypothetical protein